MSDDTLVLVLRLRSFEFESELPMEVKYAGKECGFLPVYATLEEAQAEWPDGPFCFIKKLEIEDAKTGLDEKSSKKS